MKREVFDVDRMINTDPKGFERVVDTFTETDWGLYMARGADHPQFGYIEAWLLENPSIRITKFHFRPGHERPQDYYIDIADNHKKAPGLWETLDLYVDIVTSGSQQPQLLDLDELEESYAQGFISSELTAQALSCSAQVMHGINHTGSLDAWLEAKGMTISWLPDEDIHLAPSM